MTAAKTQLLLQSLEERGEKHAMRLKDGRDLLGWIQEVGDGIVCFQPAPGPFCLDPEEVRIAIDQIDLTSLAYWDEGRKAWVHLTPPPSDS